MVSQLARPYGVPFIFILYILQSCYGVPFIFILSLFFCIILSFFMVSFFSSWLRYCVLIWCPFLSLVFCIILCFSIWHWKTVFIFYALFCVWFRGGFFPSLLLFQKGGCPYPSLQPQTRRDRRCARVASLKPLPSGKPREPYARVNWAKEYEHAYQRVEQWTQRASSGPTHKRTEGRAPVWGSEFN